MQYLTIRPLPSESSDSEDFADYDIGRDCALPMVMMGNTAPTDIAWHSDLKATFGVR